jgi:hypothetical protein
MNKNNFKKSFSFFIISGAGSGSCAERLPCKREALRSNTPPQKKRIFL